MWHIRRVFMEGVGHPDARFDPLTIDLTDAAGDPADGVVWLENMGGKTSWVSLVFSTLRPARREFLGSIRDAKKLEQYLQASDTGHIVIEWQRLGPPSLFPGLAPRLVTGQVLQWRDRRVDLDNAGTRLIRRFYGFVPGPEIGFDDLPLRTESGHRRSLREYVEALGARLEGADAMRPTDNQREWRRWLERRGLDPEVFRYQLLMNTDEGAVAEQFQWEDGNSFIRWALPYIVDPRLPEQIAAAVDKVRARMVQRDPLRLEKEFCDRVATALEEVAAASDRCHRAHLELGGAWDRGARLAARLAAGAEIARAEAVRADERCREVAEAARAVARDAAALERRKGEARLIAAELAVAELAAEAAAAGEERRRWRQTVRAHALSRSLIERRELELELQRIEVGIAASGSESALRDAVEAAAAALSRKLTALRDRASAEAAEAEAAAAAAAAGADDADRREAAAGESETAAARAESAAAARLESLGAELEDARVAGLLAPGEGPAAAADRAAARVRELEAEERAAGELAARLAAEAEAAEEAHDRATEARIAAAVASGRADAELATLDRELGELTADSQLIEAAQQSPFDPWHSPAEVLDRLRSAAETAAEERVQIELAAAADRRAVRHLESESLLPPRLEVEKTLAALAEAGIRTAYSGWQVLRDSREPGDRARVARAHPELASGVVVRDAADLARAREVLGGAAAAFPVVVAAEAELAGAARDGERFVIESPAALWDESAAADELEARRRDLETAAERIARARGREDAVRAAAARYETFLEAWPRRRADDVRRAATEARAAHEAAAAGEERAAAHLADARAGAEAAESRVHALGASLDQDRHLERGTAALARRHGARDRWIEERARSREAREDSAAARAAARTEARQKRAAAAQERERARRAESRRQQAAEELRRHDLIPRQGGDEPEDPPDVLARALTDARRARGDGRDEAALDSERRGLESRRARLAAEIDRSPAAVLGEARRLIAESAAQTEEQRATDAEAAAAALDRATLTAGRIERDLESARERLQDLEIPDDRREPLEARVASAGEAERLAASIELELGERQRELAELAAERDRLSADAGARQRDAAGLEEAAGELADDLVASEELAERSWERARGREVPPLAVDVGAANKARRLAAADLRTAMDEQSEAVRLRQVALGGVDRAANASEFAELFVGAPLRERLLGDPDDVRGSGAGRLAAELRRRGATIERDLEEIEQHRQTLTTMLTGQVRSALQTLRQLQNQSRLPEGLDEWSGRHYLVIKHRELPADPEQLGARIETVIDQICSAQTRTPTDGLSLLWGGLRAGVASDFTVEILKPHKLLRNVRVPVSEIRTFSGGQKITAALVLFAALTRMRELSLHAGSIESAEIGATLILDNPIGKASAGTLIEVQRRVAHRCGLQLVYTTGVSDLGALGAFTCVVRLDGKENLRTGAQHVTELERLVDGLRLVQRDLDEPARAGGT
jgi:hypothetical protein